MTDLTNKISNLSISEINDLNNAYASILGSIESDEKIYHAYVINYAINFINKNYAVINKIWRAWIILVLKKLKLIIKTETDIENTINDFLIFHNNNYQNYLNDIICNDEIDRDFGFIMKYIKTKTVDQLSPTV